MAEKKQTDKKTKATPPQMVEQRQPGMCGPAALRTLLSFFGVRRSEKYLARLCKATIRRGTHPDNIIAALEKMGFVVKTGTWGSEEYCWKLLNHWINKKGLPVLVDWFTTAGGDSEDTGDGHYSVAYKLNRRYIWLADPQFHRRKDRMRKLLWKSFIRVWFDFETDYIQKRTDMNVRWWLVTYPKPPLK
ncbi:MAG: cysteine peptidase family C39 domain-containing protein [bacterium]|nr:cysteine peptidase family C39 domain-containing protein [bacterium]